MSTNFVKNAVDSNACTARGHKAYAADKEEYTNNARWLKRSDHVIRAALDRERPSRGCLKGRCLQNIYTSGRSSSVTEHFITFDRSPAEGNQLTVREALSIRPLVGAVPDSQNSRIETRLQIVDVSLKLHCWRLSRKLRLSYPAIYVYHPSTNLFVKKIFVTA